MILDGFSLLEFVVDVENDIVDAGGLFVISVVPNFGTFEKIDLVGVVVVGGNVFVIVVCDGGGGAFVDVENWNDARFGNNDVTVVGGGGGGGCEWAIFGEKNGKFEVGAVVVVVGNRTWTGGCGTECGAGGKWEGGGGWETGIGGWGI